MNDTPASDEIDLTELFSILWNAKWLIFLVTAGAVFATAVLLSVSALQKNDTKYLQSYVDITGITDAQYPNGMSFSPTDLTSSDIVSRLLEAYPALDLETMSESIRAEYGHPGSRALRSEWNAALKQAQDNDASIEQIQELNQTYQNELTRLNSGSISISITHRALGVNEATAISIAQDLPRMWQTVFV